MNSKERKQGAFRIDAMGDFEELGHMGALPPAQTDAQDLQAQLADKAERDAFRALYNVALRLTGELDFSRVLEEVLDSALEALGGGRGVIFLGKGLPSELVPVVRRSVGDHEIVEIQRLSSTILAAGQNEAGIHSGDLLSDERFKDVESVRAQTTRSVMSLPMTSRGEPRGLIYVDRSTPGGYSQAARDFFQAFVSLASLAIENARVHDDLRRENQRIRRQLGTKDALGRIVGTSKPMRELIERAKVVASVDQPVVLLGESGTGKELLAQAIHDCSSRALEPFIAYNCAAVPSELMESLFFGHKKGAFSGASQDSAGLFRKAEKGVLFLDEIADLDLNLQGKLLRVLQEGTMWPVGADREESTDVRIIAATSKDLATEVREGRFREDLLYRLAVLELRLPPLRDRLEDLPILIQHFIDSDVSENARHVTFRPDAMTLLKGLRWRGNVRELESVVRRIIILRSSDEVDAAQIRSLLSEWSFGDSLQAANTSPRGVEANEVASGHRPDRSGEDSATGTQRPENDHFSLQDAERQAVVKALEASGGNKTQAAKILGIHRNSLVRRMQRFGIR